MLFVGDFGAPTGFNKVNTNLLSRISQDEWALYILGINATGDPSPLQKQFKIYPARLGGDAFGVGRIASMVQAIRPDVLVLHQDAWNVKLYLDALRFENVPIPKTIAWCPADSPNQMAGGLLNPGISLLMAPTEFGIRELIKGGYKGPTKVLGYGVDKTLYKPMDKHEARRAAQFPEPMLDAFVVGRADRNAYRKRYDLTLEYWAEWWASEGSPKDAYLYFHCAMTDVGWDLPQLAQYYGIAERVIWTARDMDPGQLMPEADLPNVFNSWDAHFSTTLGEGYGLVALESAACRIAQIVPDYSAYGEWLKGAARFMKIGGYIATCGGSVNTIGGVTDKESAMDALSEAYRCRYMLDGWANWAYDVSQLPKHDWAVIAKEFDTICKEVVG